MASGSQMWRGIMADLPIPPTNIRIIAHVSTEPPMKVAPRVEASTLVGCELSIMKLNAEAPPRGPSAGVCDTYHESTRIPISMNRSAKRVTINAFFEADTAEGSL